MVRSILAVMPSPRPDFSPSRRPTMPRAQQRSRHPASAVDEVSKRSMNTLLGEPSAITRIISDRSTMAALAVLLRLSFVSSITASGAPWKPGDSVGSCAS
jgi:hypothetical protein